MIESELLDRPQGYYGGHWVTADSGDTLSVANPATGELLAEIPDMGEPDTARAIDAALAARDEFASIETRRQRLRQIEAMLMDNKRELGRILCLEHGKPWAEAIGEIEYSAGFFADAARHIHRLQSHNLDQRPRGLDWTVHYRPAGAVGLISPWNFPLGLVAKKLSAALAADCACVIKPSAKTPLSMIAFCSLTERELDLPPGKINLVLGRAGPIGNRLMSDDRIMTVSFTGSTGVGRQLIEQSAPTIKKLCLELGGNAPFIVFEDADVEQAADNLIANKLRGSGQTCVCANRILVEQSILDSFSERLSAKLASIRVGDGMDDNVDMGPLIDRAAYDKVRRHLTDALQQGAELVHGDDPGELETDWGAYFPPVVVRDVKENMLCVREETFGPLFGLMPFAGEDDALRMANDSELGLAAYLFTGDERRAERMIPRLHYGHVGWNTGSGPTPEAPFGGMRQSGIGREGGAEGLLEFVEIQTVPRST